jgi:hypothetical protein
VETAVDGLMQPIAEVAHRPCAPAAVPSPAVVPPMPHRRAVARPTVTPMPRRRAVARPTVLPMPQPDMVANRMVADRMAATNTTSQ